jgi:hypothetical protein
MSMSGVTVTTSSLLPQFAQVKWLADAVGEVEVMHPKG